MKAIKLTTTIICLLFLQTTFATQVDFDWEETLRVQLNKTIGSENFSFEKLNATTSEKKLTGIGTFFNKSGVGFTVNYDSDNSIGFFEATMPSNAKMKISNNALAKLSGQKLDVFIPDDIRKIVYLEKFSFHFSKEEKAGSDETEKKVKQFNLVFNALKSWEIFSTANVELEQIKVDFQIDYPNDKAKRKIFSTLTGMTKIAGKSLNLSAKLTSKKEELQLIAQTEKLEFKGTLQSLVGKNSIKGFDLPDNLIKLNLKEATLTVAPYQDWMTIASSSNFGNVEIWMQQRKVKSKKETSYLVTITPPKDFKVSTIHQGLKALDAIDLRSQKIVISSEEKSKKETSKIPSMAQMSTAIKKGCSMVAKLDLTKLKVDHLIGVKNLIVSSPLTSKLDHINLDANLDTDIALGNSSKLTGVIFRLKPSPKNFAISLLGMMDTQVEEDLLKFKGGIELVLTDQTMNFLAMMKGDWHDPLGAKGLRVSDVGMQMGASFTTAPAILPNVALAGKIKIGSFEGNAAVAFDTRNPSKCMLTAGFNKLVLWDFVNMVMDNKIRKKIPADMKKALQGTYFKDVSLEVAPTSVQVLEKNYDAGFRAGGKMNVAGFKAEGGLDIDYTNGISANAACDGIDAKIFKLEGANGKSRPGFIIDLRKNKMPKFAVNGAVSLLGLKAETDIHLKDDGFEFMVGGKIFKLFAGEITARGTDVQKAGEMYLKVKMKNDFFDFIKKDVSGFVKNTTKGGVDGLRKGQVGLTKAENGVKAWDKKIKSKKKEIKKKQSKKRKAYNAAKKEVDKWNKNVNKLSKEIKRCIKLSKSKKTPLHQRAYYASKAKTLQGTKLTANGSLAAAKKVLDGLKWVNSDPNKDAQVIYLVGKKEISLKAVQAAKLALKGTEKGLGFGGNAAAWILEKGPDAIVDIKKAEFEGKLGVLSGGAVKLKLQVKWLGKKHDLKVAFDFNNTTQSIANLSKELMKLK
ncbi:MAG: hypothetical protein AB8F94_26075 [Saprospiraceae bacterium]